MFQCVSFHFACLVHEDMLLGAMKHIRVVVDVVTHYSTE